MYSVPKNIFSILVKNYTCLLRLVTILDFGPWCQKLKGGGPSLLWNQWLISGKNHLNFVFLAFVMAQFRRAERYNIKHLKIVFFTPKAYTIPSKAQKYIFFQIYTYKINFEWKSLQIINTRSLFDHWRKNRPHVWYFGEKKTDWRWPPSWLLVPGIKSYRWWNITLGFFHVKGPIGSI